MTAPATSSPPPASPPPTLSDQLAALKHKVQTEKDTVTQTTKAIAADQQDIGVLEAGLADIDATVTAYKQAVAAGGDLQSLKTFIDQERDIATSAVGTGKKDLDDDITASDKDVTDQRQKVAASQKASDDAAQAYAAVLQAGADKQAQAAYDSAKALVTQFPAWVADLKALKSQVTAAASSGNFGLMYLLVREMTLVWAKIAGRKSPDELQAQLTTALADLQQAKSGLRTKKDAADTTAAQLLADKKLLDDYTKNRRTTLLGEAQGWQPPLPQAGAK